VPEQLAASFQQAGGPRRFDVLVDLVQAHPGEAKRAVVVPGRVGGGQCLLDQR
jgi:hypothetical protein